MSDSSKEILYSHKLGHGPKILLAFHGIGQTGLTCFESFSELLGDQYTIYAFDLFFHGSSSGIHGNDDFSDQDIVTKSLWKSLISEFLQKKTLINLISWRSVWAADLPWQHWRPFLNKSTKPS